MQARFGILGPLEVTADGRTTRLGGARPRRLLAMLLLNAGQVVSADRLVDAVWDATPPASADVTLRTHVASLRRHLDTLDAGDLLVTRSPGYLLDITPGQVDAGRFADLVAQGRAALARGEAEEGAARLRTALGLWRGDVLEDLDRPRFADADAARLEELRLAALEARVDADLSVGRHAEIIGELEGLTARHPFRERFWGQLMLALYRSGRQAEALAAFQSARRELDEQLGLEPGGELSALQSAILQHDPGLVGPDRTAPPAAASVRPSAPPAVFDVARRVPLIGRENELALLETTWDAVRSGGRRIALVSGEAGIGKTRLVAELAARASEQGATVLAGHGDQAVLAPYQPVVDALQHDPRVAEVLAQAPDTVRAAFDRLVAGVTEPSPSAPPPATGEQAAQQAFLAAVTALFARLSERSPTVVVIEDAERIDRASARLLNHLAHRLPPRTLLLLCFRDPPGSRHLPLLELVADLESRGLADRLTLAPLTHAELAALVSTWTGAEAPATLVQTVWEATGGNPFFAGEVVRDLATRDAADVDAQQLPVPTAVRDVLRQRLRTLSPAAQDLVGCAAVLGREVDVELVARVTDQPLGAVTDALEEAADQGWLVAIEPTTRTRYLFRHLLMRQAVHEDLPAARRQQLHLRAAEVIGAGDEHGPADQVAIAVHLRAAGALVAGERAAEASLVAASATAAVYAWDEAISHAEAAVTMLARAGARPARQVEAALISAGLRLRSGIGLEQALRHLEQALDHYRAAGDETAVALVHGQLGQALAYHHTVMDIPAALEHLRAADAVPVQGEPAVARQTALALAAMFALRIDEGCEAAARATEVATGLGRQDLVTRVRATEAVLELGRGRVSQARDLLTEAWDHAQRVGDPHLAWEVVMSGALLHNIYLLDPVEAQAWCRSGLAQGRFDALPLAHLTITDHLAYALASMGEVAAARDLATTLPTDALTRRLLLRIDGDLEAAEQAWAAAVDHDLDHGDRMNAVLNASWLAEAQWPRSPGRAVATLRRALAIAAEGPQIPTELMVRAELARRLVAFGSTDEASDHLARCDDILARGEDWRGRVGHVEVARGAVAAATGRRELADAAHDDAVRIFTHLRLPWRRADALLAWAHHLDVLGCEGDADAKRRAARELVAELDATRFAPATSG